MLLSLVAMYFGDFGVNIFTMTWSRAHIVGCIERAREYC